jgi:hypothetical protein
MSFNKKIIWVRRYWACGLAILVALIASWIAIAYAGQPLLEKHDFRQTQTALTSYWMIQEGWRLDYQTPVVGYPWSVPMEFPIFQSIAALLAWLFNLELDPTGRLLSFCFLLACAWPAYAIARRLDLPSDAIFVFCALLWSSPLYLFWGRAFMIETAALFFTFASLPYALDLRGPQPCWKSSLLFALFSTLGLLQKITTAAPALMLTAFLLCAANIISAGAKLPSRRQFLCLSVAMAIPFITAAAWYGYADMIKSQNSFGATLTSGALADFNFGPLEQRYNLIILKHIFWDRVWSNNAAGLLGLSVVVGALVFGKRVIKKVTAISLGLFILPVLIFSNLHYIHDYYQASSALFLIFALSISTVLWLPDLTGRHIIVPVVSLLLVISNFYHFNSVYAEKVTTFIQASEPTPLALGDFINRYTPEKSAIVIFGNSWNSNIAYYSRRKAFTVAHWFNDYEKAWNSPESFIGSLPLGAIVFCERGGKSILNQVMNNHLVKTYPRLFRIKECYIWLPNVDSVIINNGKRVIKPLNSGSKAYPPHAGYENRSKLVSLRPAYVQVFSRAPTAPCRQFSAIPAIYLSDSRNCDQLMYKILQ